MNLRLLPSAFHRQTAGNAVPMAQPLSSYVVTGANGAGPIAVDAGSLGLVGEAADMNRIREVVLTHAHIDHVASLPMWLEAVVSEGRVPARVHASGPAIAALRDHLFNGHLFPDFERLTDRDGRPLLELVEFPVEERFELAGFSVLAFEVNHPVPTHGLVLDDGVDAIVMGADTGPTDPLWQHTLTEPRVRAVVVEASFPDRHIGIAAGAGHLTPRLLRDELGKAPRDIRVWVTHMKPAYREEVTEAVGRMDDPRVRLLNPGETVEVSG